MSYMMPDTKKFLLVTWNCDGLRNQTNLPRAVQYFEKLVGDRTPTVICLQETSVDADAPGIKVGTQSYTGVGTDKSDSGNQKCNTGVFWDEHFKYESRYSQFYGNRYYETVKLSLGGKSFWVKNMHMKSMGPAGYAANGIELGAMLDKECLERAPMLAVGDMNCEPTDLVSKKGTLSSAGTATRWKSDKELDWMVWYATSTVKIAATCLGVADMGGNSDHLPVGFLVEIK